MGAALLTAIIASVAGIAYAIYLGLTAAGGDVVSLHISIGIFSTMVCLFAHSMMMFYFLGKGKPCAKRRLRAGYRPSRKPYQARPKADFLHRVVCDAADDGHRVDGRERRYRRAAIGHHGVMTYSCLALNLLRCALRSRACRK